MYYYNPSMRLAIDARLSVPAMPFYRHITTAPSP